MSPKEKGDTKVVKQLLELLNDDVDARSGSNRDVDPVGVLKENLLERKFLIVLDDVWFCSGIVELLPRDSGGAVIVTSRIKHVAEKAVGTKCLFHLKPWESDKGKSLEAVVIKNVPSDYKDKEEELLVRIHGLPLAAKALALALEKYLEILKSSRELSSNISS
ncbi:hypothetical protein L6164_013002 [Bauhinia variegata]|uniref:Uncharacterized protein n=1 Tax=Bauhinia variegata TaxID=167791 RepID=A0ACB9PD08_BAUVA|nr:hypothetical protein L6164_013002 [Bauhinia variegata]